MDFMATGYAGVLPTPKEPSLRDIQRALVSAGFRSRRRLPLKIRFDVVNIARQRSTNCATAAALGSARRNSDSDAGFTERSLTIFELQSALAVFL